MITMNDQRDNTKCCKYYRRKLKFSRTNLFNQREPGTHQSGSPAART
jgi:hypothetical protein